jgi:hypothetical protein
MICKSKSGEVQLGLVLGLMLLAGGAMLAQDVKYNFMPGTNFSKYHSYKWISIPENVHPSQIVDQEIKQAIDAQLSAKGFSKTDDDKADLYLGYQCSIDQEKQWNGFGGGRFGGMGQVTSSTIQNGTLAVDFYDPSNKQLVWRGQAEKTLNPSGNQEVEIRRRICRGSTRRWPSFSRTFPRRPRNKEASRGLIARRIKARLCERGGTL